MNELIIENIPGSELPLAWKQRLGVRSDEYVNVTIQRTSPNPIRKKIDRIALQQIIDRIAGLPVLDDRTPEEILNYNEAGLPS